MRTMLESLVSEKASGGRRVLRKDIEPKQSLDKMILFLRSSYFWPYLLKFTEYVENCCDLSQFWFREFYLEVNLFALLNLIKMAFLDRDRKAHSGKLSAVCPLLCKKL